MINKKVFSICLIILLALGITACSSEKKDDLENNVNPIEVVSTLETNVLTNEEEVVETEKELSPKEVIKEELGITMTLTGDFVDTEIYDLNKNTLSEITELSIGGFSISKKMNEKNYSLVNILVVENEAINETEERLKFPYIFAGNKYSVVAILPVSDNQDVIKIQSEIIQQLSTIFFDEALISIT